MRSTLAKRRCGSYTAWPPSQGIHVCVRRVQVNCFGSPRSHSCHRDGSAFTTRVCTNINRPIYAARTRQFDPGLGSGCLKLSTTKVHLLVRKGRGFGIDPTALKSHIYSGPITWFCVPAHGRGGPARAGPRANTSTNLGPDYSQNQKFLGRKPKDYFYKKVIFASIPTLRSTGRVDAAE